MRVLFRLVLHDFVNPKEGEWTVLFRYGEIDALPEPGDSVGLPPWNLQVGVSNVMHFPWSDKIPTVNVAEDITRKDYYLQQGWVLGKGEDQETPPEPDKGVK